MTRRSSVAALLAALLLIGLPWRSAAAPEPAASGDRPAAQGGPGPAAAGGTAALSAALAVAALLGLWYRRRGGAQVAGEELLQVLASRSLGPRTRLVLLAVQERQLLLAVSERGPRLLAQWDGVAAPAPAPARAARTAGRPQSAGGAPTVPEAPLSPAIAGLLRLRRQAGRGIAAGAGAVGADELARGGLP